MDVRVVCISRTIAAGGEVIGRAVAERLGFRYVDEEVVTQAAKKARVDPKVVAAAEHKQPLIKRLIESLGSAQGIPDPLGFPTGLPPEPYYPAGIPLQPVLPEDHRAMIREAIQEIATQGRAVIVAHAASMALGGMAGVLRELVTASPETRAQRLEAAGEKDGTAAVAASDKERRDYFRSFYRIKEELPTHYDVVINTDKLAPEQALQAILAVAGE